LHAGLVIIVPNVTSALQRQLFETALGLISERDLVNTVLAPGPTQTRMYDMLPQSRRNEVIRAVYSRRICQPKEVAAAILWLGSACPEYVNGTTLDVNNGSYPR
jgi:NAD(P)-dependent dehydrogenase (short-subunit alcohol dehydrogenase family)